MCGISGIYNINNQEITEDEIVNLIKTIKHRGPDYLGVWRNNEKTLGLGHARLSILDLSEAGRQPMAYADKYWIVFNGEIYNFLEIRKELENFGYQFASDSDTEVILAAYDKWSEQMVHKFNGMWAFAIYDKNNGSIFLSRDRYGIKPLYYYKNNEKFVFSSEVKAIHSHLGKKHALNKKVMQEIARGGFANHGSAETYLENVFSLPAGHNLLLKNNDINISRWYELKKIKTPKDFAGQANALKELIFDACRIRLRSDVPVGTCLSGGVDSGSISAVINQINITEQDRGNHYTHRGFCAAFPGLPIDESERAQLIANRADVDLDIIKIDPPTETELSEAMNFCDGPMHALAFFPIWKLYKHIAATGIKVTLDGQGPDEMLGGYTPLPQALISAIQLMKPKWFRDVYETYAAQGETSQKSSRRSANIILKNIPVYLSKYYLKKVLTLGGLQKPKFSFAAPSIKFDNYLDESLYEQFFQAPLPAILNQYDRCSMASGVECRMPFMDYRIVEFIFSLPVESKVGNGYTKRILREAMAEILPDEIRLEKTKIGFNAPIVDWFRGPLRDFMLGQMKKESFLNNPYFDGYKLKNDFDIFLSSKNPQWDEAWKFWPPVHISWWIESLK